MNHHFHFLSGSGLALVLLSGGCRRAEEPTKPPLPTVTIAHPAEHSVTEYLDFTGTVAPSKSVQLVARVSGFLKSVNFGDGSFVEAGQLLFQIEPDQYEQQ